MLQQVPGLQAPKLHICILVVPHHARLAQLHKGSARIKDIHFAVQQAMQFIISDSPQRAMHVQQTFKLISNCHTVSATTISLHHENREQFLKKVQ